MDARINTDLGNNCIRRMMDMAPEAGLTEAVIKKTAEENGAICECHRSPVSGLISFTIFGPQYNIDKTVKVLEEIIEINLNKDKH